MRTAHVPSRLYGYVIGLLLICGSMSIGWSQSRLSETVSYAFKPVCINPVDGKEAEENRYFIRLDIRTIAGPEEDFNLSFQGQSLFQFHVETADLPATFAIGPIAHTGDGLGQVDMGLTSLLTGLTDEVEVAEALCGIFTDNGLHQPGYFCYGSTTGAIVQSAPFEVVSDVPIDQRSIYVLLNSDGIVVAKNYTGLFQGLTDDQHYSIYALGVSLAESDGLYSTIQIGRELDDSPDIQCYGLCGIYEFQVRCEGFDLALQKDVVGGPNFRIGDTVQYNITVTNEGLLTAYDVVVHDLVPDGLEFIPEINPQWTVDGLSLPIESIMVGESASVPIRLVIRPGVVGVDIINQAEIAFGSNVDNDDSPAIDEDSTPDNAEEGEDDQDDAVITVLDNLCPLTFDVRMEHEYICDDSPIRLMPEIVMATMPVSYEWYLDGQQISTDPEMYVATPEEDDYGMYMLTVTDANGCRQSIEYRMESITDTRPSCIGEINLTVIENCSVKLYPDMMTLNKVPGIHDFIVMVTDQAGNVIDLDNVYGLDMSAPLEVKLINPCTGQTACWGYLNLEYKLAPQYEHYTEDVEISCRYINTDRIPDIIDQYNDMVPADQRILSSIEYDSMVRADACLFRYEIITRDRWLTRDDGCEEDQLLRVYAAQRGSQEYVLDSVRLTITELSLDDVEFPGTLSGLDCHADLDPAALGSQPIFIMDSDTTILEPDNSMNLNDARCNVVLRYTDHWSEVGCAFGAHKLMREWSAINWCMEEVIVHKQFIYIIDEEAPVIETTLDTLVLELPSPLCEGDIDLEPYVTAVDDCDDSPTYEIAGYGHAGLFIQSISAGYHDIEVAAYDDCGNVSFDTIHVIVRENEPPLPILIEDVAFTYSENSSNWIFAHQFDSESIDACSDDVYFEIARESEIDQIASESVLAIFELYDVCDEALEYEDDNKDGEITVDEIFRDKLLLCCADIGRSIPVVVRVYDVFGNYSEGRVRLTVSSKAETIPCDDGDPCTIDDVERADCPCQGVPDESDVDQDGIVDCIDEAIELCYENQTIIVSRDSTDYYIEAGALPGACDDGEMATIAGEVYTPMGEMIEGVSVDLNQSRQYMTDYDGHYAFPDNPMYADYILDPYKNDDPLNGVTALDIIFIQQHFIGIRALADGYEMIAADINNDGKVSAIDLAMLRKLLLGQIDSFPNNTSWRFIPVDPGMDESDPYQFSEEIIIDDLDRDHMDEDWIGIKIGDISGDARANTTKAKVRSSKKMALQVPNKKLVKGQEILVPIRMTVDQLGAIQLGLDPRQVDIVGVESGVLSIGAEHVNITEDLGFNMVWHTEEARTMRAENVFSLVVLSHMDGELSDVLSTAGGYTEDLAYVDQEDYGLYFEFYDEPNADKLREYTLGNYPNPFKDFTELRLELVEGGELELQFYNKNGLLLFEIQEYYTAGAHSIVLEKDDLGQLSGQIVCHMKINGQTLSHQMILVE